MLGQAGVLAAGYISTGLRRRSGGVALPSRGGVLAAVVLRRQVEAATVKPGVAKLRLGFSRGYVAQPG